MNYQQQLSSAIKLFKENKIKESLNILLILNENYPNDVTTLNYLALCMIHFKEFDRAKNFFLNSLSINANDTQVLNNLAFTYLKLHKYDLAKDTYLKIIYIDNKNIDAYLNLGSLYNNLEKYEETISLYDIAIKNNLISYKLFTNLSSAYLKLKEFDKAIIYAEKSLDLNSNDIMAINNLASVAIKEKKYDLAKKYLNKALKIDPNNLSIFLNYGVLHKNLNENQEAINYFDKCIKINKSYHDAYLYKSVIELSLNNFENGWKNYEYRWFKQKRRLASSLPLWSENGKLNKVLIWGEQGLGEQILFATIIQDIINIFHSITLVVDQKLKSIFKEKYPSINVFSYEDSWEKSDCNCQLPLGSLGYFFRKNVNQFPQIQNQNNYSNSKTNNKFKCGLSWRSVKSVEGESKSIDLEDLTILLKLQDKIDFYNIQYTDEHKKIEDFSKSTGLKIQSIPGLDTFNDLAGLANHIKNFDFVVSISNTTAHLAGYLGTPTYVLLSKSIGKIWYWSNNQNENNLWYPSAKTYRQKTQDQWEIPLINLINDLKGDFNF